MTAFHKKIHSFTGFAQIGHTSPLDFLFPAFSNDFSLKAFPFLEKHANHQQSLSGVA